MTTKLKIDLTQGVLEVEGSETFVKAIYSDFKVHFVGEEAVEDLRKTAKPKRRRSRAKTTAKPKAKTGADPAQKQPQSTAQEEQPEAEPEEAQIQLAETEADPSSVSKLERSKPAYTFLDDLSLASTTGRPSLVEFMDTKFPITNEERNLVFLHYLQYTLEINNITIDHVYTCYKAAKIRVPLNIESSLEATAKERRWIKIAKDGTLSVTPAGKLYVENQLPKKIKN